MELTNRLQLPDALYRAIKNDGYTKGDADFSVTELLTPPRITALRKKHAGELTEDASDRIWSLLGQAVHTVIERANVKDLAEKRFFYKVGKHTISGQIDTLDLDNGTISDFKVTTAWSFMAGRKPKPEWEQQLNMQAFLLTKHGHEIKGLQIIGILRDWQIHNSKIKRDYPNFPVARHEVELWPMEKTENFIKERIDLHLTAREYLPTCLPEEIWSGKRCESFCNVSQFCLQYQRSLDGKQAARESVLS